MIHGVQTVSDDLVQFLVAYLPIPQAEHCIHNVQPIPVQNPIPSVQFIQDASFPMLLLYEPIWHGVQIVLFDLMQS
jgi:hypothetical protein